MLGLIERLRCDKCGTPWIIGAGFKWNDNGTMGIRGSRDIQLVILDTEIYERIFAHIEKVLGVPIQHLAFEAVRNISREVFEDMYKGIPGSMLFKRTPVGYRMTVRLFFVLASLVGYARAIRVRQIPRKYSISVVKNPYHIDLFSASILGAHEFLDGIPYQHILEKVDDSEYTVTAVVASGKPDVSHRLEVDQIETSGARIALEKCNRCGVPRIIAERLDWNMNEGIITDSQTGDRVGFFAPGVVVAMFREMVKELGEEIHGVIVDCMREWVLENIDQFKSPQGNDVKCADGFEEALRRYLHELPSFGRGCPAAIDVGASRTRIVIENPYQEHLIAGTLQGIYEGFKKQPCEVSLEKIEEGTFAFSLEY